MKQFDSPKVTLQRRLTLANELDSLLSDMLLLSAVFRARGLDLEAEELCELCHTSLERYMQALAVLAEKQVADSTAAESTSMHLEACTCGECLECENRRAAERSHEVLTALGIMNPAPQSDLAFAQAVYDRTTEFLTERDTEPPPPPHSVSNRCWCGADHGDGGHS